MRSYHDNQLSLPAPVMKPEPTLTRFVHRPYWCCLSNRGTAIGATLLCGGCSPWGLAAVLVTCVVRPDLQGPLNRKLIKQQIRQQGAVAVAKSIGAEPPTGM